MEHQWYIYPSCGKALSPHLPLPLCLCLPVWSSEGVNRTWRQLGRTHWADLNNAGIWREAQRSQPFFIPAVTPLPIPSPPLCTLEWREMLERKRHRNREREGETGSALAGLWAFAHLLCTCSHWVALETCQIQSVPWKKDREKEKRKKKQHAPLSVLARDG